MILLFHPRSTKPKNRRMPLSVLYLGAVLEGVSTVASSLGEAELAAEADAERAMIVQRIGPEVRRLGWSWAETP